MNTGINRIRLEFKGYMAAMLKGAQERINRIRLEFKVSAYWTTQSQTRSINRIRLEFKGEGRNDQRRAHAVLIESDWNLKATTRATRRLTPWY